MSDKSKTTATTVISLAIIAIVIFLGLNAKFHWINLGIFGGKLNPAIPRDREVVAIDIETHEVFYITKKKDENFPLTNPKTNTPTLWAAYVCHKEQIIFPVQGMATRCPKCGDMEVGAAQEEDKDLEVYIQE